MRRRPSGFFDMLLGWTTLIPSVDFDSWEEAISDVTHTFFDNPPPELAIGFRCTVSLL